MTESADFYRLLLRFQNPHAAHELFFGRIGYLVRARLVIPPMWLLFHSPRFIRWKDGFDLRRIQAEARRLGT